MRQSVSGSYLRLLHYPLHCHLLRGMSRYFFRGINQSKHDSNKEEKLTSPSLRIYQTNPHAPSPRIPDISAYINNQLNSPRTIHRKRLTLYKLPSAPTIHPLLQIPHLPHNSRNPTRTQPRRSSAHHLRQSFKELPLSKRRLYHEEMRENADDH